jgi:hypothetical protein
MEPGSSLPHSQEPAACLYPEPAQSIIIIIIIIIIINYKFHGTRNVWSTKSRTMNFLGRTFLSSRSQSYTVCTLRIPWCRPKTWSFDQRHQTPYQSWHILCYVLHFWPILLHASVFRYANGHKTDVLFRILYVVLANDTMLWWTRFPTSEITCLSKYV